MSAHSQLIQQLKKTSPQQPEFYQAVSEVITAIEPVLQQHPQYIQEKILERMVEPERQILFRVCWHDDQGQVHVNKGYRVQFNSALGPYKGGLRFHPSVNAGIIKFLGFEQIFKNALTGLALGGGKGGSNFDPKGKSNTEIMRFCHAFMNELSRHIGAQTDIPAGDIGVGGREIGYMFGRYKQINNCYNGTLTGKGINWGGSQVRTEATGYGLIYFTKYYLDDHKKTLTDKRCLVSGSGNVSFYAMKKLYELGAKPIACSDSGGTIIDERGIDLDIIDQIKFQQRKSLKLYPGMCAHKVKYIPKSDYPKDGHAIWHIDADLAFPCASQNEVTLADAKALIGNSIIGLFEGANMPTCATAVHELVNQGALYAPGKAANAGGVATSQLEMAQNSMMQSWSFKQVDQELKKIMKNIYRSCTKMAAEYDQPHNITAGANIAGFIKVADAMLEQGHY